MSDDVVFVAVASAGTLFGLWRVMAGRLAYRTALQVLIIIGIGLAGSLTVGGVQSLAEGGGFLDHRADLAAGILLLVVMGMPLWGLFDERILARVSELGAASVGFATAYQLADRVGEAVAVGVALASVVIAVFVARSGRGMVRIVGYGWFLGCTVVLAVIEADGALDPVVNEIVDVRVGPTFAAFAVLLWLSFHGVFASKYALVVFSCVSATGRRLAFDFADRLIVPGGTSLATGAIVLGAEGALLLSDHLADWASNDVLVAVMIFALPIVEGLAASRFDRGPAD